MSSPMSHRGFHAVRHVYLPRGVLEKTSSVLGEFGENGCEALVLWLGEVRDDVAHIRTCLVPQQRSIRSPKGLGYHVDGDVLFALNRYLDEHRLRLIAQVHSHPTDAYHSETDDALAIVTTEGGFSLVVPNFARDEPRIMDWAVYRLEDGLWQAVAQQEQTELFVITEES